MRASDVFELVVRIAGFFLVLFALVRLIIIVPFVIHPLPLQGLDGAGQYLEASSLLLMAGLGFCLLFGGRTITRVVYRN